MHEIQAASEAAIHSLLRCCTPSGLMASGAKHGHHQIWARDSMIALLGARFLDHPQIAETLRASCATLKGKAHHSGSIPNNVDPAKDRANFRAYADTGLWWVIGSSLIQPDMEMVRNVLRWYECHDIDRSSLLSMQEGADWQDLFCTRGKGLYLNCLYVMALKAAARLTEAAFPEESAGYAAQAEKVSKKINRWFWYRGDANMLYHISHTFSTESLEEHDSLGRKRWLPEKRLLKEEQYYLPYLGFRVVGEWFDSLGNLLAILSGVASEEQTETILGFITRYGMNKAPLTSLYPAIQPGDADWRDYYGKLNQPYCYHNGGIWPFIGGFYVAALVKAGRMEEAQTALVGLARLNLHGHFNEWHDGRNADPMGVKHQAWSAGMYLYAVECVKQQSAIIF